MIENLLNATVKDTQDVLKMIEENPQFLIGILNYLLSNLEGKHIGIWEMIKSIVDITLQAQEKANNAQKN